MADIDKALPNDKRPDDQVADEEIGIFEENEKGPVEITEDDEGATIDFDPNAMPMPEDERRAYNEALMDEGSMFEYE